MIPVDTPGGIPPERYRSEDCQSGKLRIGVGVTAHIRTEVRRNAGFANVQRADRWLDPRLATVAGVIFRTNSNRLVHVNSPNSRWFGYDIDNAARFGKPDY